MAHAAVDNSPERGSGADLLQDFLDFGVFRQQSPTQGDIFWRALLKKNQCIANVVGLIDGGGDLFHHLLLGDGANARRGFNSANRHYSLLSCSGTPTFSNSGATGGAERCAIWTARSGVHSWSRGADPSGRCLILHFCRPDGSRTSAFLTTTACCDHFTPQILG